MKIGMVALAVGLGIAGCSKSSSNAKLVAGDSGAQAGGAATPSAGSATAAPASNLQYVIAVSILKKEPSDAKTVKGPKDKQVANWISTLQRGEKVTLLEANEEYAKVRASDDKEGWINKKYVFPADGVTEATVLIPTDTFDRPDLLAMNVKRKVDPGALILVVKNRDLFSEVNVSGMSNAWVLTKSLVTDERAVMQAKLIDKARWLKNSKKEDEAKAILATLRSQFSDSPLPDVLAKDLGEEPAGAAPATATTGGEPAPAPSNEAAPPPSGN